MCCRVPTEEPGAVSNVRTESLSPKMTSCTSQTRTKEIESLIPHLEDEAAQLTF